MKLRDLGVLADHNIAPELVAALRGLGLDVVWVKDRGWEARDDEFLLRQASAEGRVVLTHDQDFGRLAFTSLRPRTGIIFLRPGHLPPRESELCLCEVYRLHEDVEPPFILVAKLNEAGILIRYRSIAQA